MPRSPSPPVARSTPPRMPQSPLPSIREQDLQDDALPLENPAAKRADASEKSDTKNTPTRESSATGASFNGELTFTPTTTTTTSTGGRLRLIPSAYLANAPAPPNPTADFSFLDNPYEPQPGSEPKPKPARPKKQPKLSLFPSPQIGGNPVSLLRYEEVSGTRAAHTGSSMAVSKSTTALASPGGSSPQSDEDQKEESPARALKKQRSYGFLSRSSKSGALAVAAPRGSKKERRLGLLSRLRLFK